MKLSLAPLTLLALASTSNAFGPSLQQVKAHSNSRQFTPAPRFSTEGLDERQPVIDTPPVEPGSHDELMYTLGVNLARQLGDVRPLVESGEELASVAKGLLDTVIGRFSEDGQRNLLARRGQDLNLLIAGRA